MATLQHDVVTLNRSVVLGISTAAVQKHAAFCLECLTQGALEQRCLFFSKGSRAAVKHVAGQLLSL